MLGMTRRKLLLWAVPALIGMAVVAAFMAVVLIPPCEASCKMSKIELGMTLEQVRAIVESGLVGDAAHVNLASGETYYVCVYDDGSALKLIFANGRLTKWLVRTNFPWFQRMRDFLGDAGLPI